MKLSFPTAARTAAAFGLMLAAFAPVAAFAQQAPAAAPAASANPASAIPEADRKAIQNYNLNDDVFNRIIAVSREAKAKGIKPDQGSMDPSKIHSLDDLAAAVVGADSRIGPLIKAHGFTPREFLLANLAVTNAVMASQAKNDPEMAKYIDPSKVNQANVAFIDSHKAQIEALMKESGGQ
ncbi:hypothetical protein FHW69_000595 [Luteibacter sp. Sphag1AF]|uniref:hypothetical protein n=1 Tax=Luteibacter sp. Sphag1AF TaxID=2587031 RepID=UPI00160A8C92|nr:hypothetical protein [Luteibacter sp. Sphag1AF]MBB3226005.1 hypothetical protein [Luteibacter sp. Sphag1AF]